MQTTTDGSNKHVNENYKCSEEDLAKILREYEDRSAKHETHLLFAEMQEWYGFSEKKLHDILKVAQAFRRVEASRQFWQEHAVKDRKGNPVKLEPPWVDQDPATNEDRSIVEVYRFQSLDAGQEPGYFAYWTERALTGEAALDPKQFTTIITTWVGDRLADVTKVFREHKSPAFGPFPSRRVNFQARGIDGHLYSGTYYKSSGNYVRMRRIKGGK